MDKLRAPLSVPVREALWKELGGVAARERKKLREITELLLEWGVARLREAGSVNQLLRCGIRLPESAPCGLRNPRPES